MKTITSILATIILCANLVAQQPAANEQDPGEPLHRTSPEGAVYNARIYTYDPERGVHIRPEFKGMSYSERIASIQGSPDTTGKVYYRGNHKLGLGGARWVTPGQLAHLHEREEELRQRQRRIKAVVTATRNIWDFATASLSGSAWTLVDPNNNSEELKALITGATVHIIQSKGHVGSGVITKIQGKKYVLTANHVIKGSRWACLTSLKDQSFGFADQTGGWHDRFDIAAIRLPKAMQHLPAVPLFRGKLPAGQPVFLSGFPGGHYHVTSGVITGYRNMDSEMLHTARSANGASGGMLITQSGQLCGIHTGSYMPGSPLFPNNSGTPSSLILRLVEIHGR
jgi:S1-C subfamily serine protease